MMKGVLGSGSAQTHVETRPAQSAAGMTWGRGFRLLLLGKEPPQPMARTPQMALALMAAYCKLFTNINFYFATLNLMNLVPE